MLCVSVHCEATGQPVTAPQTVRRLKTAPLGCLFGGSRRLAISGEQDALTNWNKISILADSIEPAALILQVCLPSAPEPR